MGGTPSIPSTDFRNPQYDPAAWNTPESARASAPTLPYEAPPRATAPPIPHGLPRPSSPDRGLAGTRGAAATAARPPSHIDVEMVIDDSGSMRGRRWEEACEATETLLLEALKLDSDGVEVSFLNHDDRSVFKVRSRSEVLGVFDAVQPCGSTPLAEALQRVIDRFWANYSPDAPPRSVVVITDGMPSDRAAVRRNLVDVARELDRRHAPADALGFSIAGIDIQPGSDAHAELRWLDDELPHRHRVRDIVDCSSVADQSAPLAARVPKLLYGGIVPALDAQAGGL